MINLHCWTTHNGEDHVFWRNRECLPHPEKLPYVIDPDMKETNRLYGALNKRLVEGMCVAGDRSIADMASYPWIVPHERQGQDLDDFPHLKRWFHEIAARPPVIRATPRPPSLMGRGVPSSDRKLLL